MNLQALPKHIYHRTEHSIKDIILGKNDFMLLNFFSLLKIENSYLCFFLLFCQKCQINWWVIKLSTDENVKFMKHNPGELPTDQAYKMTELISMLRSSGITNEKLDDGKPFLVT